MPNPARSTVERRPNGLHAAPNRGWGRNFALFTSRAELPTAGCVEITPSAKVYVEALPRTSFQPVENSSRKPQVKVSAGLIRTTSSMYAALNHEREPGGVGEGSYSRVPAVPFKNVCRLVNVACPYWLSARFSLDRRR